mgnify:CR=1 FL=1
MNKPLVAYFSASGTTAKAAAVLAQATKADIYEIVPETPYTPADLDWTDRSSRTTKEKNDPSFRPAIGGKSLDVSPYDTIYLGFPIWWYTAPSIIKTFLESHDFSGKTIVLFATSGGSASAAQPKTCSRPVPVRRLNRASSSTAAKPSKARRNG